MDCRTIRAVATWTLVWACFATPLHADVAGQDAAWGQLGAFALRSKQDSRTVDLRSALPCEAREPASIEGSGFSHRELYGPSWSYQSAWDGPVVAIESLGSSRKGRPKLVHVALDWEF